MKKKSFSLLLLFLSISLIVSACTSPTITTEQTNISSPKKDTSPLIFRASSEFDLLSRAGFITQCQEKAGVRVQLETMGDITIQKKIDQPVSGAEPQAHVYAAASPYWVNSGKITGKTYLAMSPVVLVVEPTFETMVGWSIQRGIDINDILVVASANPSPLNLGLPSASQDDAGINFMAAAFAALKGDGVTLQPTDISNLIPRIKPLTDRVTASGSSASRVKDVILTGKVPVNAAVLPENLAMSLNDELTKAGKPAWHVYYVRGATSLQMYTASYVDGISPDKKSQAAKFIACLAGSDVVSIGFRKAGVGTAMPSMQDVGLFKTSWGIDVTSEPIMSVLPQGETVSTIQTTYQTTLKKAVVTVILDDFSPSMKGDGKSQLMVAMKNILLQDFAASNKLQAGPDDLVWVLLFDRGILDRFGPIYGQDDKSYADVYNRLSEHRFGDATDIYGAAMDGLQIIAENYTPGTNPSLLLVTDGEQTDFEHDFENLRDTYNQVITQIGRDIPIYIVMTGNAVFDQLDQIRAMSGGALCDATRDEKVFLECIIQFKGN